MEEAGSIIYDGVMSEMRERKTKPEGGDEKKPVVVQAQRVTWSYCVYFKGDTKCPQCDMMIKLPVPNPPPPLVQCPGCRCVCLNTAAAVVNQRTRSDFRNPFCKWLHPMILLTWCLILFVIFFGIGVTIPAVVNVYSVWGVFHLCIAAWLSVNVIYNFFNTVNLEPGFPTDVQYENCDPVSPFCPKCNYAKPARAHHCSTTGCCVLRMDHFCGFAQNCIGFANHRHFLLFSFFIWLSNMYAVVMSIPIAMAIHANASGDNTMLSILGQVTQGKSGIKAMNHLLPQFKKASGETFMAAMAHLMPMEILGHLLMIVIDCICFCMISFLVYQQWSLLRTGLTVIDSWKQEGANNPYDDGWRKNIESVLGPNWWYTWMIPQRITHPSNGMHFFPPPPTVVVQGAKSSSNGKVTISTESNTEDAENAPLVKPQPYI
jgi:hypothetical protein